MLLFLLKGLLSNLVKEKPSHKTGSLDVLASCHVPSDGNYKITYTRQGQEFFSFKRNVYVLEMLIKTLSSMYFETSRTEIIPPLFVPALSQNMYCIHEPSTTF